MNSAVSALRFFFGVTLGRGDAQVGMTTVREPRRLPVVLSPEEVAGLLDAARSSSPGGLKYRAVLSVAYGAGLRASEMVSLKLPDIDSERMVIRVEPGKGRKDRYAMLSEHLLGLLRAWWRAAREPGLEGLDADQPPMFCYPCPHCGGPMIVIETFEPGQLVQGPKFIDCDIEWERTKDDDALGFVGVSMYEANTVYGLERLALADLFEQFLAAWVGVF